MMSISSLRVLVMYTLYDGAALLSVHELGEKVTAPAGCTTWVTVTEGQKGDQIEDCTVKRVCTPLDNREGPATRRMA